VALNDLTNERATFHGLDTNINDCICDVEVDKTKTKTTTTAAAKIEGTFVRLPFAL